jgi:hypothetical protein
MGYRGLLLNAPYKIDSMVWMRLIKISFVVSFVLRSLLGGGCKNLRQKGGRSYLGQGFK